MDYVVNSNADTLSTFYREYKHRKNMGTLNYFGDEKDAIKSGKFLFDYKPGLDFLSWPDTKNNLFANKIFKGVKNIYAAMLIYYNIFFSTIKKINET